MTDFPARYDPGSVEERVYKFWLKEGVFTPKVPTRRPVFSIAIPPPNITGRLTMGHVLNNTIQDLIVRYKKLKGYETLWLPGMDHAGIATQVKVEDRLRAEGKSRGEIGREGFLRLVWQWKEDFARIIRNQLRRLGCGLDWTRERFTLDERLSRAVRLVFVRLYEKGLIYQGRYMVNWCPRCKTALANEQVERNEEDGKLYYIAYPLQDDGEVVVATTRPETMLGDTGVAVNPGDARFKDLVGRTAILPIIERKIPIISDEYVDPDFGTGAVKVTPAHDPADLTVGRRHNLDEIEVIGAEGRMTEAAGPYHGLDRYECRRQLIEDLEEKKLLRKIEPYRIPIGRCERCNTVIEPRLSLQWFVRMKPLVNHARNALKKGEIKVIPGRWINLFNHWIENIEDWCISRQLWWGHPLPVYYCQDCNETIVSMEVPERCQCGSKNLIQDPDVLDTWFSSWLWPFSTLGWPDETDDLKSFYPNSLVVSGWDILFNWVLRMIIAGYEFTGKKPFGEVLFHGLIRDRFGRKMSKSLGNSPEPTDLLDKYGADGLRFGLLSITPKEQDVLFAEDYLAGGRNFVNKLWNAARMIYLRYPERPTEPKMVDPFDRWIAAEFNQFLIRTDRFLMNYQVNNYVKEVYDFVWHTFCDRYLEHLKYTPEIKGGLARLILKNILIVAHPIIPFVTEEIWSRLDFGSGSILKGAWPERIEVEVEYPVGSFFEIVSAVNRARSEWNIHPKKPVDLFIIYKDRKLEALVQEYRVLLKEMVNLKGVDKPDGPIPKASIQISKGFEAYIPLEGIIEIEREYRRLSDEVRRLEVIIEDLEKRLKDNDFITKAPVEVVDRERQRFSELVEKKERIERCLKQLAG
ncbi:MAG TPA: valine--tRNA ligase [bacterium (Candidatus Stahlbacteria)]|nr:valine--tRNA ligase [Candidatus Stahlbacteria bacterium]